MLFMIVSFVVSGVIGTIIALRLMAIEAQEHGTRLTVRGRIVVGLLCGLGIALFILLVNGMWWDCIPAGNNSVCRMNWGY